MDNHNPRSIPSLKISQDLTVAAGMLKNMQAQAILSPDGPPALFGAGGPM